tara:strand:- start:5244 stop:5867 length:624 start_codon:yes stop_codon:yes gene_type:complete
MFWFFVVFIFALGFFLGNKKKVFNENTGEALVRKTLSKEFDSSEYHLLNDITLSVNGGTTQIDHILICTSGIFVIETKHYSGWIFGDEKSKFWTQVKFKNKYKFQNPLHQNYKHIKAVEALLDFLPKENIHSAIVFTGDCKFKTKKANNVFQLPELQDFITSHSNNSISLNRVAFCVGKIECSRYQISKKTDIEHQNYLNKKFGDIS